MERIEDWRPIPGWEGSYEVSDQGRVRSLDRVRRSGADGRTRTWPGRIMGQHPDSGGYLQVNLRRPGEPMRRVLVHTAVLTAFAGPCPPGMQCLHGPAGKLDNSLANLRWGTSAENNGPDKARDGKVAQGERNGNVKLTAEKVREARRRFAEGEGRAVLAAEYGVTVQNMCSVVTFKTWRHVEAA